MAALALSWGCIPQLSARIFADIYPPKNHKIQFHTKIKLLLQILIDYKVIAQPMTSQRLR